MVLNSTAANVEANSLKNVKVNGSTTTTTTTSLIQPSPLPQSPPILGNQTTPLLSKFIEAQSEIWKHKTHHPVKVDGHTLSVAAIVAAARHAAPVQLDDSKRTKDRVESSRQIVVDKVESGASIYGLSTGFGGSADTRTDKPLILGHALLQHQHIGILPTSSQPLDVLPLQDPSNSTVMPEAWVRAAILVRMNSLIRGHSGVRWELIEKMEQLLSAQITPVVPLRGSISASGDLSPLSYIAGALVGNQSIQLYHGAKAFGVRKSSPSHEVLLAHGIEPTILAPKEHLGLVNGTAVSAAVGALAIHEAVHLCLLAQVCTAMGTEALHGSSGSYASFIHAVARPHPGQVECAQNIWNLLQGSKLAQLHEDEVGLEDDRYSLRQDRYPLRTAPQFLGPQIEDILSAFASITQECNSTTDNPLIEAETGLTHHGGNFQAMAVTNAMEKTRLALHHIGKILFAQSTELCNPAMNNGLPPSLAATDPSLNYHGKGVDIATAAYVAELGYLANPVSTHIQSAEMHNQAVNSLALISARATVTSLDVLSMLISSYLYLLCQALDLRTLRLEFFQHLENIIEEELASSFGSFISISQLNTLSSKLFTVMQHTFDKTTIMDSADQMRAVAESSASVIMDFFCNAESSNDGPAPSPSLAVIFGFRSHISTRAITLHETLRKAFLSGGRGHAPASPYLGRTKRLYEFIREGLGIRMHGSENHELFPNGIGVDELSVGQNISKIYEALRDGNMQNTIFSLFV
ncbi:phenylalanine ammonia-lyase [Phlegmacium glaucopus]|nr:phenylalanine ammonia-lyase [Phlegmacium glaucopus]